MSILDYAVDIRGASLEDIQKIATAICEAFGHGDSYVLEDGDDKYHYITPDYYSENTVDFVISREGEVSSIPVPCNPDVGLIVLSMEEALKVFDLK